MGKTPGCERRSFHRYDLHLPSGLRVIQTTCQRTTDIMNMIVFFLLAVQMHSVVSVNYTLWHARVADYRDSKPFDYYEDGGMGNAYIYSYSSNTSRQVVPVQDWMRKITAEDPQYWQRETEKAVAREQFHTNRFEANLKILNRTEGFHIAMWVSGCKWNDETDEVTGWYLEDLGLFQDYTPIRRWTAAKEQGDHIKLIWDDDKAPPDTFKFYTEECPSNLKMFVSILTRTELPKVSLLQETPSSPVSCNATGFYPNKAVMFWRKDGEKLHEGVDHGEMLQDGTFQMSVDLNVTADMEGKYECVFQLTGVKEDIVTELESRSILSNASGEDLNTTISGNNSQATSWPTTITIRPTTNGTSNDNQTTFWPNTTIEATARPSLNNSDATPPTPGHSKSTDHLEDLNTTISGNNSQATSRPTTITIRPTTNATARPSLNNLDPTPRTPGHIKTTNYLEENLSVKVAVVTVGVVAGAVLLSAIIFGIVKRYRHTHGFYWVNRPTESWVTVAMRHLRLTQSESESESESESV
ncbi:uncharacterized protein [Nerophis lumbriciformis]|uniref:uncharacterized protein n=1 Tax=Nerophis lumbriciformis TaxID=546530 RepID=UPI002AE031C4|nr:uncharacterized protein LOC133570160 isoform X2 [Nerophis lumbriciformis]